MTDIIPWIATVATIGAAIMVASNLGSRATGFGFAVFTVGSLAWLALGLLTGQQALVATNVVLTGVNLFGIWRWLGRQARLEEGARAAADASEGTPGETLFPVSLLAGAPIVCADGSAAGASVDAMAGCDSGRLAYVVASEGGVAGVGETLRRIPWREARVEGDRLMIRGDRSAFGRMQPISRDEWPAR